MELRRQKRDVLLYKRFREGTRAGVAICTPAANQASILALSGVRRARARRTWPTWEQPGDEAILALAHLTVPFVRFLNPDVIQELIQNNELHREEWCKALEAHGVAPEIYLWQKSPCAFPGVRRYSGGREIAGFRGHATVDGDQKRPAHALKLDDNDYPKQLWSFVFRGVQFNKFGPENYALAHLADSGNHGNRFKVDFEVTDVEMSHQSLFGLHTCPTNTAYISRNLVKPTDFDGSIRSLLVRRAQQLYGGFCKILPPHLQIRESSPKWDLREFTWAEPVGDLKHIDRFLEFRSRRMAKLINPSGAE